MNVIRPLLACYSLFVVVEVGACQQVPEDHFRYIHILASVDLNWYTLSIVPYPYSWLSLFTSWINSNIKFGAGFRVPKSIVRCVDEDFVEDLDQGRYDAVFLARHSK